MKLIYFLFIFLMLGACNNTPTVEPYHRSEHSKIAEKITAKTVQKIEAETNLRLIGIGGGMMGHVRMMAMSFEHVGELSVEQGRELIIYCTNEYLSAINTNTEIRPYLIHYPFTSKDIEIRIFIKNPNSKNLPLESLCYVSEIKGVIEYELENSLSDNPKTSHEETYEEAVKILETGEPVNKVRKNLSRV
jgi:hypothetical protein